MPTEIALERAQTLGSRIKAVRKQKGLQQKELALRIGCNGSHLSDIEGDKKNPSLDTLKRISEELDTTVDFFLLDSPHSCKSYLRDDELEEWYQSQSHYKKVAPEEARAWPERRKNGINR